MRQGTIAPVLLLAVVAGAADTLRTEAAGLRFSVPRAWVRVPAAADERAAQWKLRRAVGDPADGELVLFFFGAGKGGSAEENLDRWQALFAQADGRPVEDTSVIVRTVHGLRVSTVDISGTYMPGATDGLLPPPRRGYRMLAAAIEDARGPWFFRATGSEKTIAQMKAGFDAMLSSVEVHR